MRASVDNQVITFDWEHGCDIFGRFTRCDVFVQEDGKNLDDGYTYGLALCAPQDKFVKEYGRKLSLARAIEHMPRDVRAKVWETYLSRK